MQTGKSSKIGGALLILAGIAIPSPLWISLVRGTPPEALREPLLAGAWLFRAGLVALGVFVLALPKLADWSRPCRRPESHSKSALVTLGALLAASFLVRIHQLDAGLWLDEILTYVNYARMPFREIVSSYASENQHFLYSLMAHASFNLFGESAWALRLPAVLFGVAGIAALYLLGRELASAREGLFAAALLAFSYHHVWFSQNARGYTGLLFWTIFSSWLLVRAFKEGRPALWLWYALAAALGVYTHTTMLFVIAGQFISYLLDLFRRKEALPDRWAGFWLGFVAAGLFTFQLHALVLPQVRSGMARTVSVVDAWKNPLWTLLEIARGLQLNFASGVIVTGALLVFGAGLWRYVRSRPVLPELLILPPVLGASLVLAVGHHLWPRFFFFAFGFGALVVIGGVVALEQAAARLLKLSPLKARWLGTAACAVLLAVSAASVPFAFGPKQDYAGALEFANAQRQPEDVIVSAGLASFPYQALYRADLEAVDSLPALNAIRARANRTILLYTLEPVLESMYPDIMEVIRREFTMVKQFRGTLQGGTVYVCIGGKPAPPRS